MQNLFVFVGGVGHQAENTRGTEVKNIGCGLMVQGLELEELW